MRTASLSALAAIACLATPVAALPRPQQSPSYSVVDVSGPASTTALPSSTTTVTTVATTATPVIPSTTIVVSVTAYTTITPSVTSQKTIRSSVTVYETVTAPAASETTEQTTISLQVTVTPSPTMITESSTFTITDATIQSSTTIVRETSTVTPGSVSVIPVYSTTLVTTSEPSPLSTTYSSVGPASSTSSCTSSSQTITFVVPSASNPPSIISIFNNTIPGVLPTSVPVSSLWSYSSVDLTTDTRHLTVHASTASESLTLQPSSTSAPH